MYFALIALITLIVHPMFFCGDFCNNIPEPEAIITNSRMQLSLLKGSQSSPDRSTVMVKTSRYAQLYKNCRDRNVDFEDKEFLANQKSLNFSVSGREIVWRRIKDLKKDAVMVENEIRPADIQQGNIGDCYFLAAVSALAEEPTRIQNIFHGNFEINGVGIYKLVVNIGGCPTEIVIDDYVPVFATTGRPAFCKPNGREVWVMLLEKAWAKIKGSYGEISSGCPHEVLNTFSVAPCFYYQIQDNLGQQYENKVWEELLRASYKNFPVCAGSVFQTSIEGIRPQHTYTILDCDEVNSGGKFHRIMRMRNPWGQTEYTGFASEADTKFWSQASPEAKFKFIPAAGVDDGDFAIPFGEFLKNFESVDICHTRFGFSYEFQHIKMAKNQPIFIRLDVKEEHEAYLTIEKAFGKDSDENKSTVKYGYTRMVIAHEIDSDTYEYLGSKLETKFPDLTLQCSSLKPGRYLIMLQADFPTTRPEFAATFSYYHTNFTVPNPNSFEVVYGISSSRYQRFLESVLKSHSTKTTIRNCSRIGPKKQDWVNKTLLSDEGGFGYVHCHLQEDTHIRLQISIDRKQIKANGFALVGKPSEEETVEKGEEKIFIFSFAFSENGSENIQFPPPGFQISIIV